MSLQVRKCCAKGCHMRWLRGRHAETEDCKAPSWNSALFLEEMRSGVLTWSRNWRRRDVAVRLDLVSWTLGRVLPSALQYWLSLLLCSLSAVSLLLPPNGFCRHSLKHTRSHIHYLHPLFTDNIVLRKPSAMYSKFAILASLLSTKIIGARSRRIG
jgi:hypothetical protein